MEEHGKVFSEMMESYRKIHHSLLQLFPFPDISLTKRQQVMLLYILKQENVTMTGLAEYCDISRSAVSQTIAKLEQLSIIKRVINKENRREVHIEFGTKGLEMKDQFIQMEQNLIEQYLIKIDIKDLKVVQEVMRSFEEVISGECDKPLQESEERNSK
ncbi:DNA-binding MarR family transcriptional regulator [Sinobaca qinghaiensis]|uniref:DNA-binding MarR family transcriptional regulator n=1 Tax=Sinobaca qinghaiensis TaxID=342944 RepID=A0A419UX30_9BACL|nr:MarR family transcriptional regulator [Sinobaca qinghaiensis]RKD69679.1 DNA-binding MarR family transcriptional regulator [Sinobaca qinghaiensis]